MILTVTLAVGVCDIVLVLLGVVPNVKLLVEDGVAVFVGVEVVVGVPVGRYAT